MINNVLIYLDFIITITGVIFLTFGWYMFFKTFNEIIDTTTKDKTIKTVVIGMEWFVVTAVVLELLKIVVTKLN